MATLSIIVYYHFLLQAYIGQYLRLKKEKKENRIMYLLIYTLLYYNSQGVKKYLLYIHYNIEPRYLGRWNVFTIRRAATLWRCYYLPTHSPTYRKTDVTLTYNYMLYYHYYTIMCSRECRKWTEASAKDFFPIPSRKSGYPIP